MTKMKMKGVFAALMPRIERMMDAATVLMERDAEKKGDREDEYVLALNEFKLKTLSQLDAHLSSFLAEEDSDKRRVLQAKISTLREVTSRY